MSVLNVSPYSVKPCDISRAKKFWFAPFSLIWVKLKVKIFPGTVNDTLNAHYFQHLSPIEITPQILSMRMIQKMIFH